MMKFRIFEKPPEVSGDFKFLVFKVDGEYPFNLSDFQANDMESCYNYIAGINGRPVDNEDLVIYSERM